MFNRLFPLIAALVLTAGLSSTAPAVASNHTATIAAKKAVTDIPMFDTDAAAQAHCPSDTVVWLNTHSGIYHEKGMRWYGRTKRGAYVCKKEADAAGYRDTRNGQ